MSFQILEFFSEKRICLDFLTIQLCTFRNYLMRVKNNLRPKKV